MPFDENDPEVQAIMLKLKDKRNEEIAADARIRVREAQSRQIEQALKDDYENKNKILGGIEVLEGLLREMKENAK